MTDKKIEIISTIINQLKDCNTKCVSIFISPDGTMSIDVRPYEADTEDDDISEQSKPVFIKEITNNYEAIQEGLRENAPSPYTPICKFL